MKQAIVICTAPNRPLDVIHDFGDYHKYPIYVVMNDAKNAPRDTLTWLSERVNLITLENNYWEMGAIEAMLSTDVDEFFFLQDSLLITDTTFLDIAFVQYEGHSVAFDRHFSHYLGKYRREVLLSMGQLPRVSSKEEAIEQEFKFVQDYVKYEWRDVPVIDDKFADDNPNNYWDEGWPGTRRNFVLVSPYLRKYKGTVGEWIGEI